jgi:hypothetical protein
MNFKNFPKKILLILLIPFSMFLFHITTFTPKFIEDFYSKGVNKLFIEFLSVITGIIPFSLAEMGLIALSIGVPIILIFRIIRIIKQKKGRIKAIINLLANIIIAISLIYFSLTVFWSLNYNRLPFAETARLDVKPSSVKDLDDLCNSLINRANSLRASVNQNSEGLMYIPGGHSFVFNNANKGYEIASRTFPVLGGNYGKPKAVIFSKAMSYSGIIGLYCPFTGEANIDIDIPDFSIPSTTCHELAHQHGFAREDEANYIAWLTCKENPDISFQYSGTILALTNSLNALYKYNKELYFELNKKLSDGIKRDLKDNNKYWKQHEGPVEKVTNSLNDAYLKANKQKDGVYSYGRMVDLLIAEYRKNHVM